MAQFPNGAMNLSDGEQAAPSSGDDHQAPGPPSDELTIMETDDDIGLIDHLLTAAGWGPSSWSNNFDRGRIKRNSTGLLVVTELDGTPVLNEVREINARSMAITLSNPNDAARRQKRTQGLQCFVTAIEMQDLDTHAYFARLRDSALGNETMIIIYSDATSQTN